LTGTTSLFSSVSGRGGVYVGDNASFVLHHPARFAAAVADAFGQYGRDFRTEFVGYFGWISLPSPQWLVNLWMALLLMAALPAEGTPLFAPYTGSFAEHLSGQRHFDLRTALDV